LTSTSTQQQKLQQQTETAAAASSPSALKRIAQMYMDALAQRPMLTKSVTCFVGELRGGGCFLPFFLRWAKKRGAPLLCFDLFFYFSPS